MAAACLSLCMVQTALSQVPYNITGRWDSGKGEKVILYTCPDNDLTTTQFDSTTVRNDGTFVMKGFVPKQGCGFVSVKDRGIASRMIFFDGSNVEVQVCDTIEKTRYATKKA